jgi:hypothetical protein
MQMKHMLGRYWHDDLTSSLKLNAKGLNDQTMDLYQCLRCLWINNAGGILRVTQLFDDSGPTSDHGPFRYHCGGSFHYSLQ